MCGAARENIHSEIFLQIIFIASVAEFTFSKISCFHHVLLNTFRQMRLKYENCLILDIQITFTLGLTAKTSDVITIKIKAASPI